MAKKCKCGEEKLKVAKRKLVINIRKTSYGS
jgi:hypothetical protein